MELSEKNIEEMLEEIPTFSQSVFRILELTGDINSPTKELVAQITHDPILTAKVLKLVNSAFFGLSRVVDSIQQSVVYVGINTIKNLAISVAAMGALPRTNSAGLDMNHFWLHSLMTASIAKLMAQQRGVAQSEVSSYFISGLLHDIGQIIFSQAKPDEYRVILEEAKQHEKSIDQLELEIFGINHAEFGALLGEKWQLPPDIVTAIRCHHAPVENEGNTDLNKTIFVANNICKTLEEEGELIARQDEYPDAVLEWLQVSPEEALSSLNTLDDEIQNAQVFIQ